MLICRSICKNIGWIRSQKKATKGQKVKMNPSLKEEQLINKPHQDVIHSVKDLIEDLKNDKDKDKPG